MPFKEPVNLPGETPEQTAARLAEGMELIPVVGESKVAGVENSGMAEQAAVQAQADQQAAAAIAAQIQQGSSESGLAEVNLARRNELLTKKQGDAFEVMGGSSPRGNVPEGNGQSWIARARAWLSGSKLSAEAARVEPKQPPVEAQILALDQADFETLAAQLKEAHVYTPEIAQAFLRFVSLRLESQLRAVNTVDPYRLQKQIQDLKKLLASSDRLKLPPEAFELAQDYLGRAGVYVNSKFSASFNDDGRTWENGGVVEASQG